MEVRKDEFPVVVQAYDATTQPEVFIAEQVVSSQAEIDNFTLRYAGKLIKDRSLSSVEKDKQKQLAPKRRSSGSGVWLFLLIVIILLVVVGFATGWIQRTFNIEI
jgi:cobalamin biosynthesis Mg chelatase CobN